MTANLIPTRLFENVVQPMFFATRQEHAAERLPRYFTLLINISMLIQWPLMAYSAVYHRELVQLVFHGKFIEYSALLPVIIAFAFTNNVISTPITMMALYAENAGLILKSQLFGLYQIAAMLVLVPILGLYGAAISTGTLHLFRNLWVWWKVRSTARWLNFRAAATAGLLIWGPAIALCLGLKSIMKAGPLVSLIVGAGVCAVATLIYVRSPALADSDRQILGSVLHGREGALLRWIGILPREDTGAEPP
jgi:O-antigen/teichoic acid export membrane protein